MNKKHIYTNMKHNHDISLYNHIICESAMQHIGAEEYHSQPIFKDNDMFEFDIVRVKWNYALLEKVHFDTLNINSLELNLKKNEYQLHQSVDHKFIKIKHINEFKIKMVAHVENSIIQLGIYMDFILNKEEDMSELAEQLGFEFGQACVELQRDVLSCVKLEQ